MGTSLRPLQVRRCWLQKKFASNSKLFFLSCSVQLESSSGKIPWQLEPEIPHRWRTPRRHGYQPLHCLWRKVRNGGRQLKFEGTFGNWTRNLHLFYNHSIGINHGFCNRNLNDERSDFLNFPTGKCQHKKQLEYCGPSGAPGVRANIWVVLLVAILLTALNNLWVLLQLVVSKL